jgi:hypothetical protein
VPRLLALIGLAILAVPRPAEAACCYFAAKDKDIAQPAQKAFLTWDERAQVETFTVQPRFEGNAADFGMVIPTPGRPKLDEMPREFFKELAIFTILDPVDVDKYGLPQAHRVFGGGGGGRGRGKDEEKRPAVKVLEVGVVGSLDYKIIQAERADNLYEWLRESGYSYAGDEATLDFYVKKKWTFTVMKIDPMQMKRKKDGSYEGEVTPTRFTFASDKLVYPLKITQISVKDRTEALFYVQAAHKVDLPGDLSCEYAWLPLWSTAISFALPNKLTEQEKHWQKYAAPVASDFSRKADQLRAKKREPATLEWAKRITDQDMTLLDGKERFFHDARPEDVEKLKLLKGHITKGQFITKLRKVFNKDEMNGDLEFVRARVGVLDDDMEYTSLLPTSSSLTAPP